MPYVRTRRRNYKSPYFEKSDSEDAIVSSGEEFMPPSRPKPKLQRKTRVRHKKSEFEDEIREAKVSTVRHSKGVSKTTRKRKKDSAECEPTSLSQSDTRILPMTKTNEEFVTLDQDKAKITESTSSDTDGWGDVSDHQSDREDKEITSSNREIEYMSHLLQKSEIEDVKTATEDDITVSVDAFSRGNTSSRDPKVLAALALTRQLRQRALALHTFYVLEFLTFGRFTNKACDDPTIRALAFSFVDVPQSWNIVALRSFLLTFVSLVGKSPAIKNPNIAQAVQNRLQIGCPSEIDCAILVIAALRACGFDTRLILAFNPPSLKPVGMVDSSMKKLKPLDASSINSKIVSSSEGEEEKHTSFKYLLFGEVYLPSDEIWYTIDLSPPVGKVTTEISPCFTHFPYVVGFHSNQCSYLGRSPVDLAPRYDPTWLSESRSRRIPETLWKQFLSTLRCHCDSDVTDLRAKNPSGTQETRDAEDMNRIFDHLRSLPLPSRVQDFKGHPLYALKRHLLKFEVIYPPDAPVVGFLKVGAKKSGITEPIYPRECVYLCHTRETWLKEAKTIRPGEKAAKVVKAVMSIKRKLLQDTNAPPPMVELYGPWQTEDYQPPVAQNGVVPRNEHGNVELFKYSMLPIGCTHLRLPGIQYIAKRLQIDAVPAMVGWSFHKAGWAHPEYDGFVVCSEVVPALVDAWRAARMSAEAAAAAGRTERALTNWKRLTQHLLLWQRVEDKFQLAKSALHGTTRPSVSESKTASSSKASNSGTPWQPLATATTVFPRLLEATDLVKTKQKRKNMLKPEKPVAKPRSKRRKRRQSFTSDEEDEEDDRLPSDSE